MDNEIQEIPMTESEIDFARPLFQQRALGQLAETTLESFVQLILTQHDLSKNLPAVLSLERKCITVGKPDTGIALPAPGFTQ